MMKRRLITATAVFLLTASTTSLSQVQNALRLIPLEATRADIEKIFGGSGHGPRTYKYYETKEAKFSIRYSVAGCRSPHYYRVPTGRVSEITIYLQDFSPLAQYIKRRDEYEEVSHPNLDDRLYYISKDTSSEIRSLIFGVIVKGEEHLIESIRLLPGNGKDSFRCQSQAKK